MEPATKWQELIFASAHRANPVTAVRRQLMSRDESYLREWDAVPDVDLHIAWRLAEVLARAWDWPNTRVIPADPFALLNPVRTSLFDDGSGALEVLLEIESILDVPQLSEAFWQAAYESDFAGVVRSLEAEMRSQARQRARAAVHRSGLR